MEKGSVHLLDYRKRSDDESIFIWSVDDLQEEQSLVAKLKDDQINR